MPARARARMSSVNARATGQKALRPVARPGLAKPVQTVSSSLQTRIIMCLNVFRKIDISILGFQRVSKGWYR